MRPENWKLREPMRGAIAPGAPKDGLATAVQRGRPFPAESVACVVVYWTLFMLLCWKFGWLKRSNASATKFRLIRSLSLKRRATLKSITSWPGPRNPLNGSFGTTEKLSDEVSNTAVRALVISINSISAANVDFRNWTSHNGSCWMARGLRVGTRSRISPSPLSWRSPVEGR